MNSVLKLTKPYIVTLLAVVILITGALILGTRPVSGGREPVKVVIRRGSNAGDVTRVLGENRLIRSRLIFKLVCRLSGQSEKLKPGVYEFNRAMSAPEIIDQLVEGRSLESWVTMPEGFTVRQMADLLDEKRLADGSSFVNLAISDQDTFREYPFLDGGNLEGYLFPDTYLIPRDANAESIVRQMLDTFQRKVISACRQEIKATIADRFKLGSNDFEDGLHRLLTMASLVEREAKIPKDRPLVAAVLWNRLAGNMKLEVDATVSYVPGRSTDNKDHVYYRDLTGDSPYNTYKHLGLPPAPICNPGVASIKAVMEPAKVDYLFYVAKPDGSHVFTRTLQEHLAAKRAIENGGG